MVEVNNLVEQVLPIEQEDIPIGNIELHTPRLMPTFPPVNERVNDLFILGRPSYLTILDDLP
jgi:hypothetical protein